MTELGFCPRCGKEFKEYGKHDLDGDSLAYQVSCSCGFEGWEVYAVNFSHYGDEDGRPIKEDENKTTLS